MVLATILLLGACTHCIWSAYKEGAELPCQRTGQRMGLIDIHTHAEAGSNYPARCSGIRNGHYVNFRGR